MASMVGPRLLGGLVDDLAAGERDLQLARITVLFALALAPAPAPAPAPQPAPPGVAAQSQAQDRSTVGLRRPSPEELAPEAVAQQPRHRAHTERPPGPSRLEARRAARALRPGPGIIASRAIGEVFITVGVLMLLFVAYQLWWTNVLADQQAGGATDKLHQQWKNKPGSGKGPENKAGAFKPGEGFAIIHIPKIDITAPIAQGVSKTKVLDKGMVGHYDEKPLKTGMPWDKKGNFALAGHRNTHGEPFRYINKLQYGDVVVVETQSKYYTYKVTRQLPSTSPSDTGVIDPVPPKSGYTKPGRYITLTTCTPEFTSKYRLIVWGIMVDERPRSKGKPDALVD
nr:class E sortase [Streptomyces oryzae]